MSIIVVVRKNGMAAMASDTQTNCGSVQINADLMVQEGKFFQKGETCIGHVGWSAMGQAVEDLVLSKKRKFSWKSKQDIFKSMLKIHKILSDEYFLETSDDESDQPLESSQFHLAICNPTGIYEVSGYRDVCEYSKFWAIGSGRRFALGALHILYESELSAREIAIQAVEAACRFDDSCGLPVEAIEIKLASNTPS